MTIAASLDEAKELSNWLWDGLDDLAVAGGLRERLSIAALTIALHHHKALIFLLENGSYPSFMALLRPQTAFAAGVAGNNELADKVLNRALLMTTPTEPAMEEAAARPKDGA